jgi:two-component system, OmpR family, sensor kinase
MSIRLRLTLWYSGLLAVTLVAFGVLIYSIVYNNTMSDIKRDLNQVADRVTVSALMSPEGINLSAIPPRGIDSNIYGIQLVNFSQDQSGKSIDKTPNLFSLNITYPVPELAKVKDRYITRTINNTSFLIKEKKYELNGKVVGLLQVGAYTGREENLFSFLRTILWFAGLIGVVAAFCLGMFLSRKALMPINRVTEAAERIQSGSHLGHRIPREKPNDEIGRLTDTLNGMLSRMERAYNTLEDSNTAQRRFVSDASHELRTPLTTIRGNIDLLEKIWLDDRRSIEDGVGGSEELGPGSSLTVTEKQQMSLESIRDIADEARRMSRLVNDLLALARADAGYALQMEEVSLRALAEEAARRASFLPRKAEWIVGPLEALDEVSVQGNRDYLLQLLFILIENGFKYTPTGTVRLYANNSQDYIGLTVADSGIGLRPEDVPHIFERFYRADVSRGETSGTGLGLSIAKWIGDMHQAKFEVRTKLGEGTAFTVWLPKSSSQA